MNISQSSEQALVMPNDLESIITQLIVLIT